MYIRCPSCKASTRIQMGSAASKVRCVLCGRAFSLAAIGSLGATPQERFQSAEAFSVEKGIDLASAYAVLLGLMPLDAASRTGTSKGGKNQSRKAHKLQGDVVHRASTLAQRHELPMKLAFAVAKKELKLDEALRQAAAPPPTPTRRAGAGKSGAPSRRDWIVPLVLGLAMGVLILVVSQDASGMPGRASVGGRIVQGSATGGASRAVELVRGAVADTPPPATVETTDEQGRLTRISGPDPSSILKAFCAAGGLEDRCEPVSVDPTRPPRAGVMIGIVRPIQDPLRDYAISIRREQERSGWYMGSGLKPLRAEPVER